MPKKTQILRMVRVFLSEPDDVCMKFSWYDVVIFLPSGSFQRSRRGLNRVMRLFTDFPPANHCASGSPRRSKNSLTCRFTDEQFRLNMHRFLIQGLTLDHGDKHLYKVAGDLINRLVERGERRRSKFEFRRSHRNLPRPGPGRLSIHVRWLHAKPRWRSDR